MAFAEREPNEATPKDPRRRREDRIRNSPNWKDGEFRNGLPRVQDGWLALRRWIAGGENQEPTSPLPVARRARAEFDVPPASGLRVTWLGHSSMIVEMGGRRFLTDPVWGLRASPSELVGPRRFHEPPLPLSELPRIDAIVLSHDHFDHLDRPTIKALKDLDTTFVAPLGVGGRLADWGIPEARIVELDWWETVNIGGVELVCSPARHFSGRSLLDANQTLWAGWAFIGPKERVFFTGDTGMFPGFAEVGAKYGPFDLTMVESGAYDLAWPDVHLGPEQAVQAHLDLRGKLMLPVHWGTFNLAPHAWTEPAERVLAAAADKGVKVVLPKPGESFEPASAAPPLRWWPETPWKKATEAPIVSTGLSP